jgi:hypothetical protein
MKKIALFVVIFGLPVLAYLAFLWIASDFSPYFLEMDRCLDQGGKWVRGQNICRLP